MIYSNKHRESHQLLRVSFEKARDDIKIEESHGLEGTSRPAKVHMNISSPTNEFSMTEQEATMSVQLKPTLQRQRYQQGQFQETHDTNVVKRDLLIDSEPQQDVDAPYLKSEPLTRCNATNSQRVIMSNAIKAERTFTKKRNTDASNTSMKPATAYNENRT